MKKQRIIYKPYDGEGVVPAWVFFWSLLTNVCLAVAFVIIAVHP